MEGKQRYPGVNYFLESDNDIFCGREYDTNRLFEQLLVSDTVVLHADSGVGKSSLIRAGLIPQIKEYNLTNRLRDKKIPEILPVILTWGSYSEAKETDELLGRDSKEYLIQRLIQAIEEKIKICQIEIGQLPIIEYQKNLWYLVKQIQLSGYNLLIIFDQFEEIDSYSSQQIKYFAEEISKLFLLSLPNNFDEEINEYLVTLDESKEEQNTQLNSNIVELEKRLKSSALFVIREDKLGILSQLKDFLPNILKNDFLLKRLDRKSARIAIRKPSTLEGEFETPKFKIQDVVIEQILENIKIHDSGLFDPLEIQIICKALENKITFNKTTIELNDLPPIGNIIEEFYSKIWTQAAEKLKLTQESLDIYKKEINEKLVVNKKRIVVIEDAFSFEQKKVIDLLNQYGLLRKSTKHNGVYYELIHDRLVEPLSNDYNSVRAKLSKSKEDRERQEKLRRLKLESEKDRRQSRRYKGIMIVCLIFLGFAIYGFIQADKNKETAESNLRQTQRIKENTLLGFAELKIEEDPTLSLRLAEHAFKIDKTSKKAQNIILKTYNSSNTIKFNGLFEDTLKQKILEIDISGDEKTLVARNDVDSVMVFDINEPYKLPKFLNKIGAENLNHISISKSGKYVLASSESSGGIIWDIQKETPTHILINSTRFFNTMFMDPTDKFIVTSSDDGNIEIWDIHGDLITSNSWHNTSEVLYANFLGPNTIITSSTNKAIGVFNFNKENGTLKRSKLLTTMGSSTSSIASLELLQKEKLFVSGFNDGLVYIVDAKSGKRRNHNGKIFSDFETPITYVNYSSSNNTLIASTPKNEIILYNRENTKPNNPLKAHNADIKRILVSEDGEYFLTVSDDQSIKLWNIRGELLQTLSNHKNYETPVYFSHSNEFVITSSLNELRIWTFKKARTVTLQNDIKSEVSSSKFLNNDSEIVAGFENGEVIIYGLDGKPKDTVMKRSGKSILTAKTPYYNQTKNRYKNHLIVAKGDTITVLKRNDENQFEEVETNSYGDGGNITSIEFTTDASWYISTSSNGDLKESSASSSEDDRHRLELDYTGKGGVWGANHFHNPWNNRHYYTVVTPENESEVLIIDQNQEKKPLKNIKDSLAVKRIFQRLKNHENRVNKIKFSSDQKRFLTISEDRTINVYNFPTDKAKLDFTLEGHLDGVNYATFSPDGKYIVSCSDDNTVKVWDASRKTDPILDLHESTKGLKMVEISKNNNLLLITTKDGLIKLKPIELNVKNVLKNINDKKTYGHVRYLTEVEKDEYGIKIDSTLK